MEYMSLVDKVFPPTKFLLSEGEQSQEYLATEAANVIEDYKGKLF